MRAPLLRVPIRMPSRQQIRRGMPILMRARRREPWQSGTNRPRRGRAVFSRQDAQHQRIVGYCSRIGPTWSGPAVGQRHGGRQKVGFIPQRRRAWLENGLTLTWPPVAPVGMPAARATAEPPLNHLEARLIQGLDEACHCREFRRLVFPVAPPALLSRATTVASSWNGSERTARPPSSDPASVMNVSLTRLECHGAPISQDISFSALRPLRLRRNKQ